ncbi:MAG: hypothetical protein V3V49_12135 [Candidatus Krumholzibacteria bacterium]
MIASKEVYETARFIVDRHGPSARSYVAECLDATGGDKDLPLF